jgi:SAM-dependent methyltransferase
MAIGNGAQTIFDTISPPDQLRANPLSMTPLAPVDVEPKPGHLDRRRSWPARTLGAIRSWARWAYSLGAETWLIGRWLILKACATTLYVVLGTTEGVERFVIRLGNILFRSAYPKALFADYDAYIGHAPANLQLYLELWDPRKWLTDKVVLDLGAGLGQFSDELRRQGAAQVCGLDCQREKLHHWIYRNPNNRLSAVVSSAMSMPFDSATFDSVFSHTVFEHVTDVGAALREIGRVLKPGGYALISVNYFHQRGGHHLFPYIHFPWAPWIASERMLCRFWSEGLAGDQARGEMKFFPPGTQIRTLTEGAEIQLNKLTFDEFEPLVEQAGLQIVKRRSAEAFSHLPLLASLPGFKYFLQGTIYYVLLAPDRRQESDERQPTTKLSATEACGRTIG